MYRLKSKVINLKQKVSLLLNKPAVRLKGKHVIFLCDRSGVELSRREKGATPQRV